MDLVKVELDSDSESEPEMSPSEQQTDLKQEKVPVPFAFVAVTEMVSTCDITLCSGLWFPVMVVPYFGVSKLQLILFCRPTYTKWNMKEILIHIRCLQ
jgi:hypothetical protein